MEHAMNLDLGRMDDVMLTTIDNPYNPKTDYEKWKQFDLENEYFTEEFLARMANIPLDVDVDDEYTIQQLRQEALYKILEHDVLGIYKLI